MTFLGCFVFSSNTKPVDLNDKDSFSRISNLIFFLCGKEIVAFFKRSTVEVLTELPKCDVEAMLEARRKKKQDIYNDFQRLRAIFLKCLRKLVKMTPAFARFDQKMFKKKHSTVRKGRCLQNQKKVQKNVFFPK